MRTHTATACFASYLAYQQDLCFLCKRRSRCDTHEPGVELYNVYATVLLAATEAAAEEKVLDRITYHLNTTQVTSDLSSAVQSHQTIFEHLLLPILPSFKNYLKFRLVFRTMIAPTYFELLFYSIL